jgi:hypothetical protein
MTDRITATEVRESWKGPAYRAALDKLGVALTAVHVQMTQPLMDALVKRSAKVGDLLLVPGSIVPLMDDIRPILHTPPPILRGDRAG